MQGLLQHPSIPNKQKSILPRRHRTEVDLWDSNCTGEGHIVVYSISSVLNEGQYRNHFLESHHSPGEGLYHGPQS
jgi:hypothetical protein